MRISARADYALRAALELAAAPISAGPVTADVLAERHEIPRAFLDAIMCDLRSASLVTSRRGPSGGYRLARPPGEISLGDVLRAVEGPLAVVRGIPPERLDYRGAAQALLGVWLAACAGFGDLLDRLTLADVIGGDLPALAPTPARSALNMT